MAKLVIVPRPGGEPREVPLGAHPITLGREPENDVQLEGLEVSRRHCRIEPLSQGGYRVIDLGSKNGTFLNGRQISAMALDFDDLLRMGDSLAVYVEDHVPAREALTAVDGGTAWLPSSTEPASALLPGADDESSEMATWRSGKREPRTGPHTRSSNRSYLKERLLRLGLLTQNIASAPDLSRLMDTILDEVIDFTGFERGLLLLGDDDDETGARLKPVLGRYMDHEKLEEAERTFSRSLVEEALRDRRITFRTGMTAPGSTYSLRDSVISMGLETALCIPLLIPQRLTARPPKGDDRRQHRRLNRILGAIYLDSTTEIRRLDKADLQLLEAVAAQGAIALQNARLHHQATTDPLTGLYNRGFLRQVLDEELRQARESGGSLGVVILDLDHFKQVNDTYGHGVGDEVLKRTAQRIRRSIRRDDYAARWGGEEFLIVLPGSGAAGAITVAEKVADAIKRQPIGEAQLRVTASLGVATFPEHGDSGTLLIKRADQALYAAKAAGRDRIVPFTPELDQAGHRIAPYEGLFDGDSARTQRNLKAIFDTIDLLRSKRPPDEILAGALDHVCDLTRARRAMLIVERDGRLVPIAARRQGGRPLDAEFDYSQSTVRTAIRENRSLCLLDTFEQERLTSSSIDRLGLNTVMCVPLLIGGEPIGALYADDTIASREFKEGDVTHLEMIAYQLGTSLAANPELHQLVAGRAGDDPAETARLRDEVLRLRAELEQLRGKQLSEG